MGKAIWKNTGIFLLTLAVCMSGMLLVFRIPQSAIYDNCVHSSRYFSETGKYPTVLDGFAATTIDNYADCMLLDVIYNADTNRPFYSLIVAPYYRTENGSAEDDFASSVIDGSSPNSEYSRYWHGSQILVRPLLTLMPITGVRLALFCLLAALTVWLLIILLRRHFVAPAVLYTLSALMVGGWMTAFSITYAIPFLIMTGACIALCGLMGVPSPAGDTKKRDGHITCLFTVTGALTCFLDFLTTETLTFTVPFLMFMLISHHRQYAGSGASTFREDLRRLVKWGTLWILAYGAMFAMKCLLIYIVMGADAFSQALQNAIFRLTGTAGSFDDSTATLSTGTQIVVAMVLNLSCLLPISQPMTVGAVFGIFLGLLALLGMVLYLFRGERLDGGLIGILLAVACIPYIRYAVLSNHACMHYFFTYRAQMATVLALLGIMVYQLRPSYIVSLEKKKIRRNR